jgi:hypothetical protein
MKPKLLHIPSDSFALETELKQKKSEYMEHIYKTFSENFIKNKLIKNKLKMFQFRGTNLIVILKQTYFLSNLKNLLDYYVKDEKYEQCELINNIINSIKEDNETGTGST